MDSVQFAAEIPSQGGHEAHRGLRVAARLVMKRASKLFQYCSTNRKKFLNTKDVKPVIKECRGWWNNERDISTTNIPGYCSASSTADFK